MTAPKRLRKRSEFLAMRRGERSGSRLFSLEWRRRLTDEEVPSGPRFGFTVTRKSGNAVIRNRIRRRLREAVRLHAARHALADHDYVLVGRTAVIEAPFDEIVAELARALDRARRFNANPRQPDRKNAKPSNAAHSSL